MKKCKVEITHQRDIKKTIEFDNVIYNFVTLSKTTIVDVNTNIDNDVPILVKELYEKYLYQYFKEHNLELKPDISTLYFKIYKFETAFDNFEGVYNYNTNDILIFEGKLV